MAMIGSTPLRLACRHGVDQRRRSAPGWGRGSCRPGPWRRPAPASGRARCGIIRRPRLVGDVVGDLVDVVAAEQALGHARAAVDHRAAHLLDRVAAGQQVGRVGHRRLGGGADAVAARALLRVQVALVADGRLAAAGRAGGEQDDERWWPPRFSPPERILRILMDAADKRLCDLIQNDFPLVERPVRRRRRAAGDGRGRGARAGHAAAQRPDHPPDLGDLRHPPAGLRVVAGRRPHQRRSGPTRPPR